MHHFTLSPTVHEGPSFSAPLPTFVISCFLNRSPHGGCEAAPHCGSDLCFLDGSDVVMVLFLYECAVCLVVCALLICAHCSLVSGPCERTVKSLLILLLMAIGWVPIGGIARSAAKDILEQDFWGTQPCFLNVSHSSLDVSVA